MQRALEEISILKDYKHRQMLSQNKVSEVHIMQHNHTREQVVLKIIDLSEFTEMQTQLLKYNLKQLMVMNHPNIVPVREWVIEHGTAFIISEYIKGGEYFDKIIHAKNVTDKAVALAIK